MLVQGIVRFATTRFDFAQPHWHLRLLFTIGPEPRRLGDFAVPMFRPDAIRLAES